MEPKRLTYTPEFKSYLGKHPGLMGKFIEAYKKDAEKSVFGDVSFEKLHNLEGNNHISAWKANAGRRTFFVKEGKLRDDQDGYSQFIDLSKLSTIKNDKVGVVNFHFGFTCDETSFLVLDFHSLPKFDKYYTLQEFYDLPDRLTKNEDGKLGNLRLALRRFKKSALVKFGISDTNPDHAFCDLKKNRLLVFDPFRDSDRI